MYLYLYWVVPELAISHNLTLASHRRLFPGGWLRAAVERRLAEQQIGELGIKAPGPEVAVATLSGGNQQKVALGRWLATGPRVLILDEPTQGVDVGAKAEIHRIIRRLAAEGRAVLLISSDLPEVVGMSDRILVMRGGRLVAELPGGSSPAAVMEAALGAGGERAAGPGLGGGVERAGDRGGAGNFPWRETGVVLLLFALLGVLGWLAPGFFQPAQLLSLATATAPVLLVAMGLTLVILCRQIDVSVGSQFAVASVVAGCLAQAGWPMPAVAAGAVGSGCLMGLVNGGLIAGLGLPGIVVTLATLVTWREALRWVRQGEFVRDLPESFQWWGLGQAGGQALILGVAAAGWAGLSALLRGTAWGRHFYAVGSDPEAARLAGLRPRAVTLAAFVTAGALTGGAALLNALRFTDVDPKTGTGLEMQVIAAAVIGGVAIRGGRGRLWGVLAGVLLLACIAPGLVFLRWPPQWEKAIQGFIILLAVASDGWRRRGSP
ncbi:MAG: ABC transporter permease subunit [Verrucomicrobiota bacterium]